MNRHDLASMAGLNDSLVRFEREQALLPGIRHPQCRDVFIRQLIDATRKVRCISLLGERPIASQRANPGSDLFDPLMAALGHRNAGLFDEACWLVFLSVHFGKHRMSKWRFVKEVYGRLGEPLHWTWNAVSADPRGFRDWLREKHEVLLRGSQRGFGNSRKYQSMDADKPAGTGMAVQSYVAWVMAFGGHRARFLQALNECEQEPKRAFDALYKSMATVVSFGRTARFEYLTMLSGMELVPIEPGMAYLAGATSAVLGARLMLQGHLERALSTASMESRLISLSRYLGVGMQVIEYSLCNWQKSPARYVLDRS